MREIKVAISEMNYNSLVQIIMCKLKLWTHKKSLICDVMKTLWNIVEDSISSSTGPVYFYNVEDVNLM